MSKYKDYKYTVHWVDEDAHEIKVHGTYETYLEAWWSIKEWWKSNNFTPKYVRVLGEPVVDDVVTIDYGLHSAFYKIVKV